MSMEDRSVTAQKVAKILWGIGWANTNDDYLRRIEDALPLLKEVLEARSEVENQLQDIQFKLNKASQQHAALAELLHRKLGQEAEYQGRNGND